MIHFYELATLEAEQRQLLMRRAEIEIDELIEYVRPIIKTVRERGDEAVLECTAKFDRVQLDPAKLRVTREEIEEAHARLDPAVKSALEKAIANVRNFHAKQMPQEQWFTESRAWRGRGASKLRRLPRSACTCHAAKVRSPP